MGEFIFPCPASSGVTSPFGYRNCPFHGYEFHSGVDYGATHGQDILAARSGTVISAGYNGGYGNSILIDHGEGIKTRYAHASKLFVSSGSRVMAGQKIAAVGSTGQSTGPHLHFEIIIGGVCKNPVNYVTKRDKISNFKSNAEVSEEADIITSVVVKETYNSPGSPMKFSVLTDVSGLSGQDYSILIQNDKIYQPVLNSDFSLTLSRNAPACLKFSVIKSGDLNFTEGNPIKFQFKGKSFFYGYVFSKSRTAEDTIEVTAYDSLRYLKNKDTLIYADKKYSDLVNMIAGDYGFPCGEIADTKYLIPQRIEEGTLLDILLSAADLTYENTGERFSLYDDCGKLCLKNIKDTTVPILINEKTASGFSYTSTIDDGVYNKVKIAMDNKETGKREVYVFNNQENQDNWGVLQHYERLAGLSYHDIESVGKSLLEKLNKKKRTLSINDCFGDLSVRGGSKICVNLNIGDLVINNFMSVERVTHKFSSGSHFMDIECEQFS